MDLTTGERGLQLVAGLGSGDEKCGLARTISSDGLFSTLWLAYIAVDNDSLILRPIAADPLDPHVRNITFGNEIVVASGVGVSGGPGLASNGQQGGPLYVGWTAANQTDMLVQLFDGQNFTEVIPVNAPKSGGDKPHNNGSGPSLAIQPANVRGNPDALWVGYTEASTQNIFITGFDPNTNDWSPQTQLKSQDGTTPKSNGTAPAIAFDFDHFLVWVAYIEDQDSGLSIAAFSLRLGEWLVQPSPVGGSKMPKDTHNTNGEGIALRAFPSFDFATRQIFTQLMVGYNDASNNISLFRLDPRALADISTPVTLPDSMWSQRISVEDDARAGVSGIALEVYQ